MSIPDPRKLELDSIVDEWAYAMDLMTKRSSRVPVDALAREASALVMSIRKDDREAGRFPRAARKTA